MDNDFYSDTPWEHEETAALLSLALNGNADAILGAFDWCKTPEGPKFWMDAFNRTKKGALPADTRARLREMYLTITDKGHVI